jgi:hypothetical protein
MASKGETSIKRMIRDRRLLMLTPRDPQHARLQSFKPFRSVGGES